MSTLPLKTLHSEGTEWVSSLGPTTGYFCMWRGRAEEETARGTPSFTSSTHPLSRMLTHVRRGKSYPASPSCPFSYTVIIHSIVCMTHMCAKLQITQHYVISTMCEYALCTHCMLPSTLLKQTSHGNMTPLPLSESFSLTSPVFLDSNLSSYSVIGVAFGDQAAFCKDKPYTGYNSWQIRTSTLAVLSPSSLSLNQCFVLNIFC